MQWRDTPAKVRPMLATLADPPLTGKGLVFEPKYDGIRALVHAAPARGGADVRIWSRLGNDKTSQFPSLAATLAAWARALKRPVLLDGEIVALHDDGRPAGFQKLQGRIHLTDARDVERIERQQPVALLLFDILRDGDDDVRGLPLTERRVRLERAFKKLGAATTTSGTLRISEQVASDGRALHERALREGWEGLIVKEAQAPYHAGRRSPAWRKLKVLNQEEFVIGGWTEPRQSRQYFGALLLGVPDEDAPGLLRYVGHTGTGFDQKELARVSALLKARECTTSPFSARIKSNEPAHWVRPELVAQIRFTEWTADRKLRHPVYLGLRDDVKVSNPKSSAMPKSSKGKEKRGTGTGPLLDQLRALEDARRDGTVELPDGSRLGVTNPAKLFWPKLKLTKGDLLRYYAVGRRLHPPCRRRPSARHETLPQRHRRQGVLPAAVPPGEAARRRADRNHRRRHRPDQRAGRPPLHRRIAHHAALHDADRGDLAGSRGSRASSRRSPPTTSPSTWIPATARRSRACWTSRGSCTTSWTR